MAGFDFEVVAPAVDESPLSDEDPGEMVVRLATIKAKSVASARGPSACILACDTTVVLDGAMLGKPDSRQHAVLMLMQLAGTTHQVITGYALRPHRRDEMVTGTVTSQVTMRDVSAAEAAAYAATGEPLDKAGAYALQGEGARFVSRVDGSRSNVIGLPLETLVPLLERHGVVRRT
jgi:septum formation protein